MMSLPSCEAETRCRRSVAQCMAYILARWPLSVRRVFMAIRGNGGISLAIVRTFQRQHIRIHILRGGVRSASLRSSFFCLIFSFNWSPSRFAAMIFSCQSDMIDDDYNGGVGGEGFVYGWSSNSGLRILAKGMVARWNFPSQASGEGAAVEESSKS